MKSKDVQQVKKLNKKLSEYTDRYEIRIENDVYIIFWDNSLEEEVFKTIELSYAKPYINGFILGRSTKG